MNQASTNNTSWEGVFANLTEDISMYCWVAESWNEAPEGYDQATLLWDILNSRSRGISGLALAKNAPDEYKDSIQKLNQLWQVAENELNGIIEKGYETIKQIINKSFIDYQSAIAEKLESTRKIAQDGILLDDPGWVEDDLREIGNEFLIEFQQMANLREQLESGVFPNHEDFTLFIEKYNQIEALFRKSFGFFNPLADSLHAIQIREYDRKNWWLVKYPEKDDIQEIGVPEDVLEGLMSSFRKEPDKIIDDCPELENAILYAFKELPDEKRIKFKEHLYNCDFCSQLVHDVRLSEMEAREDALEAEIPEPLLKAIKADDNALAGEKKTTLPIQSWLDTLKDWFDKLGDFFTFRQMIPVAVAALLAVVIFHKSFLEQDQFAPGMNLSIVSREAIVSSQMRGDPEYKETPLKPYGVLKSGEFFKIKIQIDRKAFYYLILKDSQGFFTLLGRGEIEADTLLTFPDSDGYQLDNKKGRETVFLIASEKKIDQFDNKLKKLKERSPEEVFAGSAIKKFEFKHE